VVHQPDHFYANSLQKLFFVIHETLKYNIDLNILWVYTHNILFNIIIMPQKDGTGPNGEGPKTGREIGTCSSDSKKPSETKENSFGRGFGRGRTQCSKRGQGKFQRRK